MSFKAIAKIIQKLSLSLPATKGGRGNGLSPIFIIGAPRSGTTIIFDSVVGRLKVGYFSNLMMVCPRLSLFFLRCFKQAHINYIGGDGRSEFGFVSGVFSPSEGGAFNRYLFENSEAVDVEKIRSYFNGISSVFGASIVNKNLFNSLRIRNILAVFPRAFFIYVRRDPRFVVQSIYLARIKLNGSALKWWSVRPPGCPTFSDPIEEIVWQVAAIERKVKTDLSHAEFSLELSYESFCEEPLQAIEKLKTDLGLQEKEREHLSDALIVKSNEVVVENRVWRRIEALCDQYELYTQ